MRAFLLSMVCVFALAQEPYRIGGGVSAPVPRYKVEPGYSSQAKEARVEGTCLLSLVIDAEGVPRDLRVVRVTLHEKDSGKAVEGDYGLGAEATAALERWRFKPGEKDGKPVPVKANVEMNFKLN